MISVGRIFLRDGFTISLFKEKTSVSKKRKKIGKTVKTTVKSSLMFFTDYISNVLSDIMSDNTDAKIHCVLMLHFQDETRLLYVLSYTLI